MMNITAIVPSFNNVQTIYCAAWSLKNQSYTPTNIIQIDDGSTDGSCQITESLGISINRNASNKGRGYVRAMAIELCKDELIAFCDASNYLRVDFLRNGVKWFDDPQVAAVFGQICQDQPKSLADRWRARHLYKMKEKKSLRYNAVLSTYGCILRRSAIVRVGNFDHSLRHSEDSELGYRLLAAGYKVVFDPSLHVISCISNSVYEVLDRYWRWNAGAHEETSISAYIKLIWYSIRVLVRRDISDKDLLSIPISLVCPHFQFWKSWSRNMLNRVQK
jgi:GT2 family glycosyltransferase